MKECMIRKERRRKKRREKGDGVLLMCSDFEEGAPGQHYSKERGQTERAKESHKGMGPREI